VLDKLPKIETHEHAPIEGAEWIVTGMPNPPEIPACRFESLLHTRTWFGLSNADSMRRGLALFRIALQTSIGNRDTFRRALHFAQYGRDPP
jgi:hypothetical protein